MHAIDSAASIKVDEGELLERPPRTVDKAATPALQQHQPLEQREKIKAASLIRDQSLYRTVIQRL